MMQFNTYLTFDGNAREAMTFYNQCLGGDLKLLTFGEAEVPCSTSDKTKIMHASIIKNGEAMLMASDASSEMPVKLLIGNNFSICVNPSDMAETEKIFHSLSKNGKIIMPLEETFWATRFGMFTDQFGVNWMISLNKAH